MMTTPTRPDAFPAPSKTASGSVGGVPTEATCTNFSDKILLTISQDGRLSQWISVPLSAPSPAALPDLPLAPGGASPLPASHLTATTLLGGGGAGARETLGQLYAAQVASVLARRDVEDRRTLVLGLGLGLRGADAGAAETERESFFDVLELVMKVL